MDDRYTDMLVETARDAMKNAYTPYSNYRVGAAVMTASGNVYSGCNVENSSYPVGLCAERVAAANAIAAGERKFIAIAIFSEGDTLPYPCGMCRQFLSEFCEDTEVIVVSNGGFETMSMGDLLPHAFTL